MAWRGAEGFYYSRFPEPGTVPPEDEVNYSQIHWHTLGTPQEETAWSSIALMRRS